MVGLARTFLFLFVTLACLAYQSLPDEPSKEKSKAEKAQSQRLGRVKVLQFEAVVKKCIADDPFEQFFIFLISESDQSSVAYVHLNDEADNDYRRPNDIVLIAIDANTKLFYELNGEPVKTEFRTGDVVQIPAGCGYKLKNLDRSRPAQLLAVFSPNISGLGGRTGEYFERWGRAKEFAKEKKLTLTKAESSSSPIIPYNILAFADSPETNQNPIVTREISHSKSSTVTAVTAYEYLRPHVHPDNDEVFIVLGGRGQFYHKSPVGGTASHQLRNGSIVHIPQAVGHAFKLTKGEKAVILAVHAPGLGPNSTQAQKWDPSKDIVKEALEEQKKADEKRKREAEAEKIKQIRAQRAAENQQKILIRKSNY